MNMLEIDKDYIMYRRNHRFNGINAISVRRYRTRYKTFDQEKLHKMQAQDTWYSVP